MAIFHNIESHKNTDKHGPPSDDKSLCPYKKNKGWLRHSNFLKIRIYNTTLSPNHNKFCGHVLPNPPPSKKKES